MQVLKTKSTPFLLMTEKLFGIKRLPAGYFPQLQLGKIVYTSQRMLIKYSVYQRMERLIGL